LNGLMQNYFFNEKAFEEFGLKGFIS